MKYIQVSILILALIAASTSAYTTSVASDLAHFSSISYESQASIDAWNCQDCKKYPAQNPKSFFSSTANIQGFGAFYPKDNAVVIAFRGSVDVKNWIYNLNTAITGYSGCSGCQVHLGFYNAYKGVAPLVRNVVSQLLSLHRGAKLFITGHSLGGAMAILCGLDMKEIHGKVDLLYTFGQPRVGNQNFADFLQSQIGQTYRVINYADTVPHVPPSAFSFKHGGHQIWYNPRGMSKFSQCVSEDKNCANSISTTAMSTDDHSLSIYMTLHVANGAKGNNMRRVDDLNLQNYTDEEISQMQAQKVAQIKELIKQQINIEDTLKEIQI